jgi:LemA protein
VKRGLVVLGAVALAAILLFAWFISVSNALIARELAVRERWAQVQNVYQRRADLVPNLVEVVKGFAAQERAVLEEVTRARASVAGLAVTPEVVRDPEALRKFQEAQAELGGALSRLLAVVERYPDLKSSQSFLTLQSQLEGTENRIAVERRRYNEAVREYNTAVTRFPGSLVASLRGFSARRYFEASPGADAPPAIKF